MAASCTKGSLDWMLRNILSLEGVSSIGTGCQGTQWSRSSWKYSQKHMDVVFFGMWFSGALGNVSLTAAFDAFGGIFLPLWFHYSCLAEASSDSIGTFSFY